MAVDLQRRSDGANRREDELAPRRSNESVIAKAKALTTAAWKTQSPPDLSHRSMKEVAVSIVPTLDLSPAANYCYTYSTVGRFISGEFRELLV